MRQVFDSFIERFIYRFLRLPALSPVEGWVLDKSAYPLLFMLQPARLASTQISFL